MADIKLGERFGGVDPEYEAAAAEFEGADESPQTQTVAEQAAELRIEVGTEVMVRWDDGQTVRGVVVGIVDRPRRRPLVVHRVEGEGGSAEQTFHFADVRRIPTQDERRAMAERTLRSLLESYGEQYDNAKAALLGKLSRQRFQFSYHLGWDGFPVIVQEHLARMATEVLAAVDSRTDLTLAELAQQFIERTTQEIVDATSSGVGRSSSPMSNLIALAEIQAKGQIVRDLRWRGAL